MFEDAISFPDNFYKYFIWEGFDKMTISQLEELITKAATIYYTGQYEGVKYDGPILTDAQFDQYVRWLKSINPKSAVFKNAGWGYNPATAPGDKVDHIHGGMGSIENKPRDFSSIPAKLKSNVRISAKLDGLSGKMEIIDGKFKRCSTRGNGVIGIDKTDKMETLIERYGGVEFPDNFTGEIRGEFVISQANWNILSAQGKYTKHARNAASGIINADEVTEDLKYLDFIPYKIIWDKNNVTEPKFARDASECLFCKFMPGFPTVPWFHADTYTSDDLLNAYQEWMQIWPVDGVVISSDDIVSEDNGIRVYDEVAFKFDSLKKITKVTSIDWQVGTSCKLTPVANLEPVEIDGAVVTRVTLHNARNVVNLNICPGAEVEIMRSGGVIPWLTQVVSTPEDSISVLPDKCSRCGAPIVWRGVDIVCSNELCGNINAQNLKVWIHCLGMVDGISDISIFQFLDRFKIGSIDDLYSHTINDFEGITSESVMAGKFYKMMDKLFNSPVKLSKALQALNITRLGEVTAKKLSESESFVNALKAFIDSDFDSSKSSDLINAVCKVSGNAISDSVCSKLKSFENLKYVRSRIVYAENTKDSSIIGNIAITGKLSMPRKQFVEAASVAGYVVKDDVNRKTLYLVTNELSGTSGKHKQADALGIKKISESEFLQLLCK